MDPNQILYWNDSASVGGGSAVGGDAFGDTSTTLSTLLNAGLGAWRSKMSYDLASQQVAAGQYPSVSPTGALLSGAGAANSLFSLLIPIIIIVLIVKLVSH